MSGKFVLIPLKTFQDFCVSTKRNGNQITGTVQKWNESSKSRTPKNKRLSTEKQIDKKKRKRKFESESSTESSSTESEVY